MVPQNLTSNVYLVHLILSKCGLHTLLLSPLPNVKYFDLSFNQLQIINMDVFVNLVSLEILTLTHNPLTVLQNGDSQLKQWSLLRVDFSYTNLRDFGSEPLSHFPVVRSLNLSHTKLRAIGPSGFRHVPMLTDVDLSDSPVQTFPENVFSGLTRLQRVVTDNYKLCCPDVLPDDFKERNCQAPRNELSSCQDLLRSEGYRVFLWLIYVCAVTGNIVCLAFRFRLQKHASKSAFNTFVSSLCIADFLMGVISPSLALLTSRFKVATPATS
jgi:hypothetical protein